jgi:hypothetical protein
MRERKAQYMFVILFMNTNTSLRKLCPLQLHALYTYSVYEVTLIAPVLHTCVRLCEHINISLVARCGRCPRTKPTCSECSRGASLQRRRAL